MNIFIHPTAIVSDKAILGDNVSIGPYTVIEGDVRIGNDCEIRSHAYIANGVTIGNNNKIHANAVIGTEPQDLKFTGIRTEVIIGDNNTIREFATINRGTEATKKTLVGSNNLIMTYCHIAHDNVIGSNIVIANATQLGGHVTVEDWAILGGVVKVHQFCTVGCHTMIGADVKIVKDVPPYVLMGKEPAKVEGINAIGLRRRGFTPETIKAIDEFYDILLRSGYNTIDGLRKYEERDSICEEVDHCIDFIKNSKRGIYR